MQNFLAFLSSIAPSKIEIFFYKIGAGIGAAFGMIWNLEGALNWLFVFMAVDYITGIIQALYNHNLSSKVGFKGLIKKAIIISVVILFHGLAKIAEFPALETMAIFAFSLNELFSILENIERSGFAGVIPPAIKKLLAIAQSKNDQKIDELK